MWDGKCLSEPSMKEVLAELDIYTFEDYKRLVAHWMQNRLNGGQEKIDALRQAITNYYYNFTHSLKSGQYISIEPAKVPKGLCMDNYMCIFPQRTLIETESPCSLVDLSQAGTGSYDMPPDDFYRQYFRYQNLVEKNIAHLYPVHTPKEMNDGKTAIVDSSSIVRLKNVAEVFQDGQFEKVAQQADIFYLAFPWLYGADTGVFLDICNNYPAEFENLSITIGKLALASNEGADFQEVVLKELKDALSNIQIAFDKKRYILKSKGIATTLGIALTCVPFAIPHFFENFNPTILSTIIGSASLVGSKELLSEFLSLKHNSVENPFWVIWEWARQTPRPQ